MKSTLVIFFCIITLHTFSQKHVIKTNPLLPFFGGFDIEYDYVVSPKISITSYLTYGTNSVTSNNLITSTSLGLLEGGANFGIQTRFDNPRSWYISPRIGLGNYTASNNYDQNAKGSVLSLVGVLGYQWVLSKKEHGLVIDLYGGVNYLYLFDIKGDVDVNANTIKTAMPRINIMLGYAF